MEGKEGRKVRYLWREWVRSNRGILDFLILFYEIKKKEKRRGENGYNVEGGRDCVHSH